MDTPSPAKPAPSAPALAARTSDASEWRRKSQGSGYIRKVKVLSGLLRAYAPHRRVPTAKETRDDASMTQVFSAKARAEVIHWFLVPFTDSGRRDRSTPRA